MVFVGASFGGVVVTEMLHNLFSSSKSSQILENVKLVLLDVMLAGDATASGFSGLDDIQPQGEIVTKYADENNSIDLSTPSSITVDTSYPQPIIDETVGLVHRSNKHAPQSYSGPDATAMTGNQVI